MSFVVYVYLFVFVKQKTAYEMRISDWSSDVCSSDLMGADFDMKQYGLKPVNVKTAGGYIFISLAENPPAIDDFLATLTHYMEPYDMENTKVAVQTTLMEKANWKLVLENNRERSEEHPSELQSLMRISYAVFCLKK